MDSERATLSPEPGLRGRGFDLGWDPQGALAARLQVAALPTVVVLDRGGRISFVQGGARQAPPRRSRTASARPSPPPDEALVAGLRPGRILSDPANPCSSNASMR
jgi:hypothetical protein